jgi:hypothetical protein
MNKMNNTKYLFFVLCTLLAFNRVLAANAELTPEQKRQKAEKVLKNYGQHLLFEKNKGQFNKVVLFKSSTSNAEVVFLKDRFRFVGLSTDTITFTINGTAPYKVTGGTGTKSGNTFTSDPLTVGTGYIFNISDANNCNIVNDTGINCGCVKIIVKK